MPTPEQVRAARRFWTDQSRDLFNPVARTVDERIAELAALLASRESAAFERGVRAGLPDEVLQDPEADLSPDAPYRVSTEDGHEQWYGPDGWLASIDVCDAPEDVRWYRGLRPLLDRLNLLASRESAAFERGVRAGIEAARKKAASAHPDDGQCCWENPEGHWGSVSTADSIEEEIRGIDPASVNEEA